MDAFRETHELMDSLIASYQSGVKDDTDAVRELQRMVADTLSHAGDREQQVQQTIKGACLCVRVRASPYSAASHVLSAQ